MLNKAQEGRRFFKNLYNIVLKALHQDSEAKVMHFLSSYCVRAVSWLLPGLEWNSISPSAACVAPPEDEQVRLKTCKCH
jgi:hypothetical protein